MSLIFQVMPNIRPEYLTPNEARSTKKGLILVVEDSEDIRTLLIELLEDEGYRVIFAADGEAGIAQANLYNPQLILMDLSLPGLNGWQTVRRLRQQPEFADTPIVALTAHATDRDEERALEAGCSGYISKPFDMNNLLEQVVIFMPS